MKKSLKKYLVLALTLVLVFACGVPESSAASKHVIIVNSRKNTLGYFVNNKLVKEFRVATGKKGSETPTGKTKVVNKIKNRPYYKGNIPGGSPRNPLGDRWMGLALKGTYGDTYGIHGNNNESSIGKHISGGCIRMHNKDVRWLFDQVPVGSDVIIDYSNDSYVKIAAKYKINLNQTGWKTENGKKYYVKSDGTYQKNSWLKVNGKMYYFDASGVMQTGWKTINNKKYYLGTDGARVSGWKVIDGKTYYFNSDGVMQTGWQEIDGNKYYFDKTGIMQTGWQQIDGKSYYLDKDGKMLTGSQKIDGKDYTFNEDGTINPTWDTIIGANRFDTAKKISSVGNWNADSSDTVILVNGNAIADGITATPLASSYDSTILLTNTANLPTETVEEMKLLAPKTVILIGGENAISSKLEQEIKTTFNTETKRIAGQDRYQTATRIAEELGNREEIKTAYMVSGNGEADALSVASKAGEEKQPIILVNKDGITEESYKWLTERKLENAYFIGGPSAINDSVIAKMNDITTEDISGNRIYGDSRVDTNAKVIEKFYGDTDLQAVLVSKSDALVDALSAGPLAVKLHSPIVLMDNSGLSSEQQRVFANKKVETPYQIGGGVSYIVMDKLMDILAK
ncbi:TPA: cell wall-binding protein Cwp22 [Clostridioides difficile]|uniref:cell wall-binding protein Cwp22 n=1 Tax=Clostridioides difficile TaxID=1496 RepID=UPI00093FA2A8|nr:cell wall-binding protein Cwp22 [Clostridioides difficile]EGT5471773.1 cell wall-binding protein Cwp22 [Clostridioides difficile]MBG0257109.1 cell wall-binding protein Cwp22 [Clostridioides difficile]MBH7846746.1 cell wall-binding protein Cwp22 [Clostridioides difficile]MBY1606920.1 cell wall-binding protein Cwp22 [Clostridioides difficile]MBY1715764.1 cell wall-binding protein Cwp22 [Clostridioides difficile]